MLKKVMLFALVAGVFTSCSSPQEKLVESYYENQQQESLQEAGFAVDFSSMSQKYEISDIISDVTVEDSIIYQISRWSTKLKDSYVAKEVSLEDVKNDYSNSIKDYSAKLNTLKAQTETLKKQVKRLRSYDRITTESDIRMNEEYYIPKYEKTLQEWIDHQTDFLNYANMDNSIILGKKFDVTIVTSIPTMAEFKVVNTFYTNNDFTEVIAVE